MVYKKKRRLVDGFDVVLLDLMDTLMFGGNRFSADEDYARTYRQLGGTLYSEMQAQHLIHEVYERMRADYNHPDCFTNFPAATVYIEQVLGTQNLPRTDAVRLGLVFAHHELGHIPADHIQTLHALKQTHRLGVVSNLWAEATLFRDVFRQTGIHDLFDVLVFSSDHACIKPSPRLFGVALTALSVAPERVLFVGDDADRDVAAARSLGMSAVLVNPDDISTETQQIRSVVELVS